MNDPRFEQDQSGIADGFEEGFYLHYRRGRVMLPVRVWFGGPPDIEADIGEGEDWPEMERSLRWNVALAGVLLDDERVPAEEVVATIADVWPRALGRRVAKSEYDYRMARIRHAKRYEPEDPFAHPTGRVDHMTAPPPF